MKTIFVIDDKNENIQTAKKAFDSLPGLSFTYFSSRDAVFKALTDDLPDGILTDFDMPETTTDGANVISGLGKYFLIKTLMGGAPSVGVTSHGYTQIYVPGELVDPSEVTNPNLMPHLTKKERFKQLVSKEPTVADCIDQIESGDGEKSFLSYEYVYKGKTGKISSSANNRLDIYASSSENKSMYRERLYMDSEITKCCLSVRTDALKILMRQIEERTV